MSTLVQAGIALGIIILFYVLWAIYARLTTRDISPDAQGFVTIVPGPVSWVMGIFSALLFLLFGSALLEAIISLEEDMLFWFILGPPLIALMGFSTYIIIWSRLRVSEDLVLYRGLNGWQKFKWVSVEGVEAHWGLGPRLHIKNQRKLYFWPYGYGTKEVASLFLKNEKPFVLE